MKGRTTSMSRDDIVKQLRYGHSSSKTADDALMSDAADLIEEPRYMGEDVAAALKREFGHAPDERDGEKWCVYGDRILIVIHHSRKPRLYEQGCQGSYIEIEPDLRGICG